MKNIMNLFTNDNLISLRGELKGIKEEKKQFLNNLRRQKKVLFRRRIDNIINKL